MNKRPSGGLKAIQYFELFKDVLNLLKGYPDGLHASTAHLYFPDYSLRQIQRILQTLRIRGYVIRNEDNYHFLVNKEDPFQSPRFDKGETS
jgi:hypothetical protein